MSNEQSGETEMGGDRGDLNRCVTQPGPGLFNGMAAAPEMGSGAPSSAGSEVVERVARALCRCSCIGEPGDGYLDANWKRFEPMARAAIETLREPTHAMASNGAAALYGSRVGMDWRKVEYLHANDIEAAYECWPVMIDAALNPPA